MKSIRVQLLILIFAAVLPAIGIIIYSNYERQRHDIDLAKSDALNMVRSLANNHENVVEVTRGLLQTIAALPAVRNQDSTACVNLFKDLLRGNTQYTNIFAADLKGMIFASALSSGNISIKHRKYFQEVLRSKEFSVGEYVVGPISRRAVLPFAYPVKDSSGEVIGVIGVSLDLEKYGRDFMPASLFPPGSTLNLLDRNFTRLYRYPDNEKYVGKMELPKIARQMSASPQEGIFSSIGVDGAYRLFAYKRLYLKGSSAPYLYMRVGIPEEKALVLSKITFLRNMGLLIVSLITALLIAWFLGKALIVKRLNRLVEASRRLAQGDLSIRTGTDPGGDELGLLARSFDEMAEALDDKEQERKKAEQELVESEMKFKSFTEQALVGAYLLQDGVFKYVNPRFAEMFGYTVEECLKDMPFENLVFTEDLPNVQEQIRKRITGETEFIHYTFRGRKKDGKIFDIEIYGSLSIYKGRIAAAGTLLDVTKSKRADRLIEELIRRLEVEKDHALKSARIDGLTGIMNRRYFDDSLRREFFQLRRNSMPLSLILMDIDYFKKYNDRYGHIAGDECLRTVAVALQNVVKRPSDVLARYGGEEFVAILPDTLEDGAKRVGEQLRKAIEGLAIPHDCSGTAPYVTISLGVTTVWPSRKDSPEQLLEMADGALYRAKKKGRNRLEIASDEVKLKTGVTKNGKGFIQLVWEKKNECGIATIDQQHQRLFDTSNKVLSALIEGCAREESLSLIARLLDETVEHFHDEEEMLFSKSYPLAEDHRKKHKELIRKAEEFVGKYHRNELKIDELFNFLAFDVVSEHMYVEDAKYYPYVI